MAVTVRAETSALLSEISLQLDEKQTLPLGPKVSLKLTASRPKKLAKSLSQWSHIKVVQQHQDSLELTIEETSSFTGSPAVKHSSASFVIDVDEANTKTFISSFPNIDADNWQVDELSAYVNDYIDDVTYIHGFNIASVVAEQRSGDCTEHAILVTALARGLGLPSRVIIGTVIVEEEADVSAFGHAWSEVWHQGQWHLLDAALYELKDTPRFYLPAAALDNEGPGFTLSLAMATALMPIKLTEIKSAIQ
ncbi:transglutaminase-like domain-containing protein [Paraglaciecola sp. 2405UD69-4]|uniref:transglutaminase-like domain-containing protein n=1 Tax=Paraglaciecola sp. 2405UD69-4 TaxID=3391836 RepID=UPI0039C9EAFA